MAFLLSIMYHAKKPNIYWISSYAHYKFLKPEKTFLKCFYYLINNPKCKDIPYLQNCFFFFFCSKMILQFFFFLTNNMYLTDCYSSKTVKIQGNIQ